MKNKIFFIFGFIILFFVFIFFFSSNVWAFSCTIHDEVVDFGSNIDKYILSDYVIINNYGGNASGRIFIGYRIYSFYGGKDFVKITKTDSGQTLVYFKGLCNLIDYDLSSHTSRFVGSWDGNSWNGGQSDITSDLLYTTCDLRTEDLEVVFPATKPPFKEPFIVNSDEIKSGKFDKVVINSGDYEKDTLKDFYLLSFYYTEHTDTDITDLYPQEEIYLDSSSKYCVSFNDKLGYIFEVPLSVLGIDLKEGNKYGVRLAFKDSWVEEYQMYAYRYIERIDFNIGVVTTEEKEQADRDKQIALQEEQNETSKGIWDTLKSVLDVINPFSENFFVYKFIELLIEAIKSLFIPSEDFFTNFATDMNEWLSDRLGILYYPIDLVVDFLERIGNLESDNSAVISWIDFKFMGATLLQSGSYDLYSLVNGNDTLKSIHSIYLIFTDVILWLGLIFLAKNTFVDIFGGKYDVDDVIESSSAHDNKVLAKNIKAREERRNRRYRLR